MGPGRRELCHLSDRARSSQGARVCDTLSGQNVRRGVRHRGTRRRPDSRAAQCGTSRPERFERRFMNRSMPVLIFRSFVLVGVSVALAAAPAARRDHTVTRILRDGIEKSDAPATLRYPDGRISHSIVRGQRIKDNTSIEVPAHVKVVLVSSGDKSTTTLGPNTSFTPTLTDKGESSRLERGNAFFSVVHGALDFFQVHVNRFSAAAKGTDFRVDSSSRSVTLSVVRGSVDVTRSGAVAIGSRHASGILYAHVGCAGSQVSS